MEETYTNIDLETKTDDNRQKSKVVTKEVNKMVIFSDNSHIADLQQRLIRLEYEVLFIKDKLFEESRTNGQSKLSPYGKVVKRRLSNG